MQHISTRNSSAVLGRTLAMTLIAAAALSACGGGGGSPGTVGPTAPVGTTGPGTTTPGTGTGTTTPTPAVTETKVTVSMVDGADKAVNTLSGGQSAALKAVVLTPDGKPAVNAIVQFSADKDGMVVFSPSTGSALTDAKGIAVVMAKPASLTADGAVAITATSVVEGKTGTAGVNVSIGAAPLTLGSLSFASAPTGTLPAFSTLALNIPVTSGGQPAEVSTGLVLTSLCAGDGTATLVMGAMNNGVQTATYTNKGCVRGEDTITATIGSSSQYIKVPVGAANIGTIQFTNSSAGTTSIVLKGSGGEGRAESAQVTFRVVDQQGNGLAGVDVNFSATTNTGGLIVTPARATTDSSGNVSATVTSGTIPTPVRVIAKASRNGMEISGLSDALTISTGLPIQKSMSMSVGHYNIEGWDYDGTTTPVTIMMADQYGNPVSNNTAVNFVTEGGAVANATLGGCVTTNGACSVDLRSQNFRPTNGRVTVLAYAQGIEDFTDKDGNGQYSCSGYAGAPGTYRPLVDACPSGGEVEFDKATQDMGDAFLDANFDGVYDANTDLPFPYGHTGYLATGNGSWGMNYIRRSVEVVFSGSTAYATRQIWDSQTGAYRDWTVADGEASEITLPTNNGNCIDGQLVLRLADQNNNPMPYGTTLAVGAPSNVSVPLVAPDKIASTNARGGTFHYFSIKPSNTTGACVAGSFALQVTTPKGNITAFMYKTK